MSESTCSRCGSLDPVVYIIINTHDALSQTDEGNDGDLLCVHCIRPEDAVSMIEAHDGKAPSSK